MLLAALSGEHILFIGPPGTAKSELGRRLSRLYHGAFFERLLTRFSVPEVGCRLLLHSDVHPAITQPERLLCHSHDAHFGTSCFGHNL